MLKFVLPVVSLLSLGISGCSSVDNNWVKSSLQEKLKACGGEVVGLTLVKEGLLSNRFEGFAEVKIDGIGGSKYYPDVTVYNDGTTTFYKNQDACALHKAEGAQRELEQSMNQLGNSLNQ